MGAISTTTNTTPFQFPGNRLVCLANGHAELRALVKQSTADNYIVRKSTDGGATWSDLSNSAITRTNIADIGSIYIDNFNWTYWVYRLNLGSEDIILYRRLYSDGGGWTNEQEIGRVGNGGVAGAVYSGLDLTTHLHPNGWTHVAVAVGTNLGGLQGLTMLAGTITNEGELREGNFRITGTKQWLYAGTAGRVGPSIDKEHGGDGYDCTFTTPNLWVTFGRTEHRMVKIPWSGDGWTGSSGSVKTVAAAIGAADTLPGKWDGERYIMVCANPASTSTVLLLERNQANSVTTTRTSPVHTQGVIRECTMSYDVEDKDVRVFAVGTGTAVVYYCDYIRATDTWTAWTSTGLASILGANVDNWGVRISSYGYAHHGLYTAASGAPNTLTYTPLTLSYAPDTPTWVSPSSGDAQNTANSLVLDWTFTDPDPADSQKNYALSRQVGALALEYWRSSDGTWQVAEVKNVSGTSGVTLTATQAFVDGLATSHTDPAHSYRVKVWDQADVASAYSDALIVIPSTPINPVFVTPTAAQVLTTDHVTTTWTATEQTQFRIILSVTAGAQVYDSGWIAEAATRSYLVPYTLPNSTNWTLTLQTKNNEGLVSTLPTRQFTVAYITPMTPTLVALPITASGVIRITITNPTPSGGAPAVSDQDIYRRVTAVGGSGVRIAAAVANAAVYDDWRAKATVPYQYMVFTRGTNGTSTSGAWTA